jgi:hypothetical protein
VPDLRAFHDDVCAAFEQLRAAAVARYMQKRTAKAELEIEVEIATPEAKPKPRRRNRGGGSSGGEALAAAGETG